MEHDLNRIGSRARYAHTSKRVKTYIHTGKSTWSYICDENKRIWSLKVKEWEVKIPFFAFHYWNFFHRNRIRNVDWWSTEHSAFVLFVVFFAASNRIRDLLTLHHTYIFTFIDSDSSFHQQSTSVQIIIQRCFFTLISWYWNCAIYRDTNPLNYEQSRHSSVECEWTENWCWWECVWAVPICRQPQLIQNIYAWIPRSNWNICIVNETPSHSWMHLHVIHINRFNNIFALTHS